MAMYFSLQEQKAAKAAEEEEEHDEAEPTETDRLLGPRVGSQRRNINGSTKRNGSHNRHDHLSMLYNATPPDRSSFANDSTSSLDGTLEETEPLRADGNRDPRGRTSQRSRGS